MKSRNLFLTLFILCAVGLCLYGYTPSAESLEVGMSKASLPDSYFSKLKSYKNHSYLFVEEFKTWSDAKAQCETWGGHLATLTTVDENDFCYNISGGDLNPWIGLGDSTKTGNYKWVTSEALSFTNWDSGQPDKTGDAVQLMTGGWTSTSGKKWKAIAGTQTLNYICEWDTLLDTTTGTPTNPTTPTGTTNPTPTTIDPNATPTPTATTNTTGGLNVRCTSNGATVSNVYLGETFGLEVSVQPVSGSSGGIKVSDIADCYLSLASEKDNWEFFMTYDLVGNIMFRGRPIPIVADWRVTAVDWTKIADISLAENDTTLIGTYIFKGYVVTPGATLAEAQSSSYSVSVSLKPTPTPTPVPTSASSGGN